MTEMYLKIFNLLFLEVTFKWIKKKLNDISDIFVEEFWRSRGNAFPIPIALAILILWIGFSAALFCLWETEWGYLTSVYFFFVSIR